MTGKFLNDFSPSGKIILLLIVLGFLGLVAQLIRDMVHPPPTPTPPTCEWAVERSVTHCIKHLNTRERDMECMDKGKEMLEICKSDSAKQK